MLGNRDFKSETKPFDSLGLGGGDLFETKRELVSGWDSAGLLPGVKTGLLDRRRLGDAEEMIGGRSSLLGVLLTSAVKGVSSLLRCSGQGRPWK